MAGNTNEIFASIDSVVAGPTLTLSTATTACEYNNFVLIDDQGSGAKVHGKQQRCTELKHVRNLPLIDVNTPTDAVMQESKDVKMTCKMNSLRNIFEAVDRLCALVEGSTKVNRKSW